MAAIIAAGMARFGDRWDKDEAALVKEDLEDLKNVSSINAEEVFLANISYPLIRKNQSLQKSVSELTGIPIVHSFSEECGGSIALQQAAEAIDSGRIRKALVIGVDKMSDLTSSEIGYISALSLREEWQNRGLTLAAAYALLENLYLEKYSKKSDEMHALPVSAHEHGSRNKNAQFQNMISAEQVAQSALTAEPIRQLECADWCDGAAALLLVSNKEAESHDKPVYLKEHAQITAASALEKGETLIPAIQKAIGNIKTAVQEADIFELHDIFSFGEVMCIESLGCCNIFNFKHMFWKAPR